MAILNDVVTADEIRPIVADLFNEAGFHGYVFGYMRVHDDGEMTAEFLEVEDADGEVLEDEDLAYNIGLVLGEQRFDHMLDLMNKYPDLKDQDLEIKF